MREPFGMNKAVPCQIQAVITLTRKSAEYSIFDIRIKQKQIL